MSLTRAARPHRIVFLLLGLLVLVMLVVSTADGTNEQTVGLFVNEQSSFDGYTIFGQMRYPVVYLIDNEGRLVHAWDDVAGSGVPYLLEDGSMLRLRRNG